LRALSRGHRQVGSGVLGHAGRWWRSMGLVVATVSSLYKGHRFPVEIISHCVWLYHRFPLSLREVQEMMAQRGVIVSHDTIHQWSRKFGQVFASRVRGWSQT
jgi:transposase-like protein